MKWRKQTDRDISRTLESLIATGHRRLEKIQTIVGLGCDATELLLKKIWMADDTEDVLARKYWIKEILGCMDRHIAMEQWLRLRQGAHVPLERVFGALDIFLSERPAMTLDELSAHLDGFAQTFLDENPESEFLSNANKASAIIDFLRRKGFKGPSADESYRDLQNNLLSIALLDPNHPTLPLISVILFCCVAQRLGLDAHPCGMPFHMRAIVLGPGGRDNSYFDPFATANEVSIDTLRAELSSLRVPLDAHRRFLGAASTIDMIQRAAGNISSSLQLSHGYHTVLRDSPTHPNGVELSPHRASYAMAVIQILFSAANEANSQIRNVGLHGALNSYVTDFNSHFRLDASLLEETIIPSFGPGPESDYLEDMVRMVRSDDTAPRVPKPRLLSMHGPEVLPGAEFSPSPHNMGEAIWNPIKYPVGTLFRHKRYAYMGAVTGWDNKCNMPEQWMQQMQVDNLSGGREQCFYHALVEDESTRYVAEENIELVRKGDGGPSQALLRVAGRAFKRWDQEAWKFVSNIRDEYPQD